MDTRARSGGITARWRLDAVLVILSIHVVVSAIRIVFLADQNGSDLQLPVVKLLAIVLSVLTCAALLLAARRTHVTAVRRAFCVMGLAMMANPAGNVLLYLVSGLQLGDVPFPSVADPVYLLGYPLMLVGVLMLSRANEPFSERLKLWLDVATTVAGGGMVFWYFLIYPIASSAQPSLLASVFAVAYPVADLVLLVGMATVFLRTSETLSRHACLLFGAGVAVYLIADATYSYLNITGLYVDGTAISLWCEVPYQVALVLLSCAAYVTARPDRGRPPSAEGNRRTVAP